MLLSYIEIVYTKNSDKKYQNTKRGSTKTLYCKCWKIDPVIVITAGARAATHTPSMKNIETTFKIPKHTFEEINVIAIQYALSIILHKGE
jgi:hypothetical protein